MARIAQIGGGGAAEPLDPDLDAIAALAPANNDVLQRKAGAWTNRTPAQVKTDLALTKADVGLANADNTTDAGKPISTATQTALDGKQSLDSDLTAIAAIAPANDDVIQRKAGAWVNRTPAQLKTDLALAKADVGLANVDNTSDAAKPVSTATATALGLKQDADSDLTAIAAIAPANDDVIQRKGGVWVNRTPAQLKTDMAITDPAPLDQDLIDIAAIAPANNDLMQRKAGAWTNRTVAQFRADLYPTTTAAGTQAHAEGDNSSASGAAAHAEGGFTVSSGANAHAEGYNNTAAGFAAHVQGEMASAPRYAQSSQAAGGFGAQGDAQTPSFVARRSTTDATPAVLTFNGSSSVTLTGTNTNVLTIPVNRAHQFRVSVVARRSDVSGDTAGWEFKGLISRGSSGNAALVGTTVGSSWGAAGAAAWDVTLSVNTTDATNNYLAITVTGEAAKTIRWVARIDTVEVG